MKQGILEITLLSDLCDSDGGVYNSSIDTDICHDENGFPYIPAKRIKGCLRECAGELADWGMDISEEELFGMGGDTNINKGKVRISDAYIKGYEKLKNQVQEASNTSASSLFHTQNILDHFTYIRTQTSIDHDTGTADPNTLRTTRVINKGLVFEAKVIFDDSDPKLQKNLENTISIFHHMGIARTRGLGEVNAVLKDVKPFNSTGRPVSVPDDADTVVYEIHLDEPLICKSAGGSQEKTIDYIEGSKIIGLIAGRLHDNNAFLDLLNSSPIYFSNAYLEKEGHRLTEVPASDYSIKNNKVDFRNRLYENGLKPDVQLSQMHHCYVFDDNQQFVTADVQTEIRYHHARPQDKSIGRAAPDIDEHSQFYQISSIAAGQTFTGFIHGTHDKIKKITELISQSNECLLGYGCASEYGHCSIQIKSFQKNNKKEIKADRLSVKLNSQAIIYSQNAMASVDPQDLVNEILDTLYINKDRVDHVSYYLNYAITGGFNVTWGMPKPVLQVFDQGTVVDIHFKEPQTIQIPDLIFLGERTSEGFGEAEIISTKNDGAYKRQYTKKESRLPSGPCSLDGKPFLQKTVEDVFIKAMRSDVVESAAAIKISSETLKPVVANMSLMCKEQDTLRDIRLVCENRFNKKGEKKIAKWNAAEKILKAADESEEKFENSFSEEYHLKGFNPDKDHMKYMYLNELLTQLKYNMRQAEEKEEQYAG